MRELFAAPMLFARRPIDIDPPLRAELFNADQMEDHGATLASFHRVQRGRGRNGLLARLDANQQILVSTCALLSAAISDNRRVTPASEWLLDNYYLIDEHLRTARRHFPQGYSDKLPRLANGASAGLPRVYDIALNAISHGDGRFDQASLHRFIASYQSVAPLTVGELWAVPIMLRLALIENLRRVASRMALNRQHRDLAAHWGEKMAEIVANDPKSLILAMADLARSDPPVTSSFVAELMQRLHGQSASLALPVSWLEQRLAEAGLSIDQLVQAENQQQAADQLSVSNSIGSLRLLLTTDWRLFVEALSQIEQILGEDPAQVYREMDFATRDAYRHVVERLAQRARQSEASVAAAAIALAAQQPEALAGTAGRPEPPVPAQRHVGYFLVGEGSAQLHRQFGLRGPLQRVPVTLYLGSIALLNAALVAAPLLLLAQSDWPAWLRVALGLLFVILASQLAQTVVHWLTALLTSPRILPRLDFSEGLPAQAATLVAVPTMLGSPAAALEAVEELQIRFLANRDPWLSFALLTDFPDADQEVLTADQAIVDAAVTAIEALNRQYPRPGGSTFYLLHRARRWNPKEGVWMGVERKRGKLADLNALLRGHGGERFSRTVGDLDALTAVRYVITLDADTQLPHESARQLIGILQHPLNRPRFDPQSNRVIGGYGILQPRVGSSLPYAGASRYAEWFGGDAGLDPYTRAVSDVYQDLFGEGSFTGKGIYDVDAFERAMAGRMPDNQILSHDLLEGGYARSGLACDVALFESFPQRYSSDIKRRHRWIRGDWQIARWLWPYVARADGSREHNPLSALARWKILDNLRRSLQAPALFLLLLAGWCLLTPALLWTALVLQMLLLPWLGETLLVAAGKAPAQTWGQHAGVVARSALLRAKQLLFNLACLPYEALIAADAIARTLWRLRISRRRMLEWTPSNVINQRDDGGFLRSVRMLWFAPFSALSTALWLSWQRPDALPVACSILLLWLLAPVIVWWASRRPPLSATRLDPAHIPLLRGVARRTWHFFERYVTAEENWLPPDNYQEPGAVIAHRTSPTNIGLSLLANLAALDFGFLSLRRLLDRTEACFNTLDRLERYRGHFYNWYDTRTLQALNPRYVSTVDSGNLCGHLLTLRQGLLALIEVRPTVSQQLAGLADSAAVLQQLAPAGAPEGLHEFRFAVAAAQQRAGAGPEQLLAALQNLAGHLSARRADPAAGSGDWLGSLQQQCKDALDENLALGAEHRSLRQLAQGGSIVAQGLIGRLQNLAERAESLSLVDYEFLYDRVRHLFCIGFNVNDHRRDSGFYDLLASEARLGVFVAIAQGQAPTEAWFALGRLLTHAGGPPVLLSWSGSMFEYLMPTLVMPAFPGSLLEQTERAAVCRQISYGREREVPWGLSECGYNATDAAQNYQYRAFGVPGLGLQRGLAQELVIAPYASALALLVNPQAAAQNLQRLADCGWLADCGFYEAIDYTPTRITPGQTHAVVRSFMAHHQGMSLLAITHVLLDRPMQRRFERDPQVQSALLLLQERVPQPSGPAIRDPRLVDVLNVSTTPALPLRYFTRPDPHAPALQLLSNGRYHVMVTASGAGYSRWRDIALTRWREDPTQDPWGSFCYLRDLGSGRVWSTAAAPTHQPDAGYEAIFTEARIEFRRRIDGWETHTEIVVSPEDDIELRRTRITNRSTLARTIEVTSFAEVVLAPAITDTLHPAFSNLFVQTEILPARDAILCTRRPRHAHETPPWLLHLLAVHEADGSDTQVSFETDRAKFIGRCRSVANPRALDRDSALSGSAGSVLDPIVAVRHRIHLKPEQTVVVDFITGFAVSRDHCLQLVDKYHDQGLADRVIDLAWTHSQMSLRQINIREADAQTYARLAGRILYLHAALRADADMVERNRRGQPALWAYAISGDLPIVLVQIGDLRNLALARDAVQAHAYCRMKGLAFDLILWNEERGGYRQELHDALMAMIAASVDAALLDRPAGIFVRAAEQTPHEDRVLLHSVARVVLSDRRGSMIDQLQLRASSDNAVPKLVVSEAPRLSFSPPDPNGTIPVHLCNGLGGFSADRREYVIISENRSTTPAPWINVLANPHFGCIVSESGVGYTWRENAHEYRLTPWQNDPLTDNAGEAFYLRDEQSGKFWSPSALPARGSGRYTTRHGFGYSVFEHSEDGIQSEQRIHVSADLPVKFIVLRVRNRSGRRRKLSVTGYVEWILGDLAQKSATHVVTQLDPNSGALFASNAFNPEFGEWVSFFDVDEAERTLTGDRGEFIGRNRHLADPAAMHSARLSGRVGALMDPCGAIQIAFELGDGDSREIIFRLGAANNAESATAMVLQMRKPGFARNSLSTVREQWNQRLGAIEIETPDSTFNPLVNGWLLYQVISSRLWGRSGYYQSGGAFGFRDQLQDTLALVHAAPQMLRAQLLLCASRQFREGDVQHWWHPPSGRGVRTLCSDDYLWLPLATSRYVQCSGDVAVLDEIQPFLDGRLLNAGEESYYDLPLRSSDQASLYTHCVRAIEHGLRLGPQGLPLIGCGDWNDGMNNVGMGGRGESVWLGFFLFKVIQDFIPLASARGDLGLVQRLNAANSALRGQLETSGWDGEWFRRAYFDDGTPLGSAANEECRIDSISQSWAVLSGAVSTERGNQALDALDAHLVRPKTRIIQLLDPPFDKSAVDPGYIRGYVPGVRENGGQYTHAAIWAVMAFVEAGRIERAWQLLDLINPLRHASSASEVETYKVEPYVAAADVYAVDPHSGRGGWTWYTGSAGWLYRLMVESLLGIRREGEYLRINPRLPAHWPGFRLTYRVGATVWHIAIRVEEGAAPGGGNILLTDDGGTHEVEVVVPRG